MTNYGLVEIEEKAKGHESNRNMLKDLDEFLKIRVQSEGGSENTFCVISGMKCCSSVVCVLFIYLFYRY